MCLVSCLYIKHILTQTFQHVRFWRTFYDFSPILRFYAFTILFFICTIFDNAVFKEFFYFFILDFFFAHCRPCKSHGRELTQSIPMWSVVPGRAVRIIAFTIMYSISEGQRRDWQLVYVQAWLLLHACSYVMYIGSYCVHSLVYMCTTTCVKHYTTLALYKFTMF